MRRKKKKEDRSRQARTGVRKDLENGSSSAQCRHRQAQALEELNEASHGWFRSGSFM
jgi:uncharacterized protein YhaN